jgi:hypothetical protein
MASLKYKPDKLKYLTNVNTLDEMHKKHASSFITKKQVIPEKRTMLDEYTQELHVLEAREKESYNVDDIRRRSFLRDQMTRLKEELYDIENGISELDYYSRTNDILSEYYNILDSNDSNDHHANDTEKHDSEKHDSEKHDSDKHVSNVVPDGTSNISNKLVELNLISQKKRKVKRQARKRIRKIEVRPTNNILSFFGSTVSAASLPMSSITETSEMEYSDGPPLTAESIERVISNRATLFDEYLLRIDRTYASSKKKTHTIRTCYNPQCAAEKTLIQSEGIYVCQKCGEVENIIIESETPNHKEATSEKVRYPYKRLNHLTEFCSIRIFVVNVENKTFCTIVLLH